MQATLEFRKSSKPQKPQQFHSFKTPQAHTIFDDLYRLTGETIQNDPVGANNGMIGYVYDPVGNRNQRTSSVTPIQMQNFTGQYDQNDRLTAGFGYDSDGNTTSQGVTTYSFDSLDRMTQVSAPGLTENFVYDGDGNKVSQNVNGTITNYLVDTHNLTGYAQVLDELQSGTVNRTYTYGTSRISEDQFNGTSWNLSFYGYDGQGSVRYLMDGNGNVTDTYTLDAFGNSINTTGTTQNTMLFDGEQNDPNTGFYNLRARWMNPSIGRFQTMDSFVGDINKPQSLHKYMFVADDPTNKQDSSGHDFDIGSLSFSVAIVGILETFPTVSSGKQFNRGNARQYLSRFPSTVIVDPTGVDIDQNIIDSSRLDYFSWVWDVWPNHKWDYKFINGTASDPNDPNKRIKTSQYEQLANLGNFNYGATGKATGLPEGVLLRGAGIAELFKQSLDLNLISGPNQGIPFLFAPPLIDFGHAPFGDNPKDQVWIKEGFKYYNSYYSK